MIPILRRRFLQQCGLGFGTMALASLMARETRAPHFKAKAKRVVFLFQAGGPSHLDLYDNKPELTKRTGKLPPKELLADYRAAFINPNSALLGPKFKFTRYGKCGVEMSELLPR